MRTTHQQISPVMSRTTVVKGMVRTMALVVGSMGIISAADVIPHVVYLDDGTRPAVSTTLADGAVVNDANSVDVIVEFDDAVVGFDVSDITAVSPATAGTPVVTPLTESKFAVTIPGVLTGDAVSFTIGANTLGNYEGDAGGNDTTVATTTTVTLDTVDPVAPTNVTPDLLAVVGKRPTITGTAEIDPNGRNTVEIYGDRNGTGNVLLGTAAVTVAGEYAFTPDTDMAVGTWSITVKTIDGAGNVGPANTAKTLYIWDAPTFTTPGDNAWTTDTTPTLGGTNTSAADISGITVTVKIDSGTPANATLSGGTWSYTPGTALTQGDHTLVIRQTKGTNSVSITKTIRVDSVAPTGLTLTGPANTNNNRPTITISGLETSPSQLVPVVQMDSGSGYVTMAISASGALTPGVGTSAYVPSVAGALADGTYSFKAAQIDAAGNTSGYSTPISVRVKATVTPPTIDTLTTNDNTPTITGTSQPGATVTLRLNNTPLPAIIADNNGDWSYTFDTARADGVYSLTARQTDLGGAVSLYSGAVSLKVDTQSPSAPIISLPVTNTVTSDTTPTFSGTAEANSTVQLFVDGVAQVGTGSVSSAGTWTLTSTALTVSSSTYSITVKATDAAGNVSPASVANKVRISTAGVNIALTATGSTPASGGALTSLTTLPLLATITAISNSATVGDVLNTSFTATDIEFSPPGSGRATLTKRTGSNSHTWNIVITPVATSGTMTVKVPASAFQSPSIGINADSNTYLFNLDRVKPAATITSSDSRVNDTHFRAKNADGTGVAATAFNATITFTEAVTGLTVGDFLTVGATVSSVGASGDGGITYPLVVTRLGSANSMSVSLKTPTVNDLATPANVNLGSAVFTRLYDATPPTAPVIASALGAANPLAPAKAPTYPCTVTFPEAVTGFTVDDLSVTNGIISGFAGSGAAYTFTLTPAEGQVSVSIPANVCTDLAGFLVPASNEFKRVLDSNSPEVAQITSPAIGLSGFSNLQVPMRVVFSEPMTGFSVTDLRVNGATVSNFVSISGGAEYTFNVWPLTPPVGFTTRTVQIIVPAASANDTAANVGAASTLILLNYNSAAAAFVPN